MRTQGRRPRAAFFVSRGALRRVSGDGDRSRSQERMRTIIAAAVMLVASFPAVGLESTRQLLESGAAQLALDRVERHQPREAADARWGEWEIMRLRALTALARYRDVLARVGADASGFPERERRQALGLAARSALEGGEPARARGYAARALWQGSPEPDEERALRMLVIESYLAEGNGQAAFRTMLRFAQDYHPVGSATAARFAEGLLALDMAREAANWLSRLEEGSPAKQMLRLKAGLVKPEAAIGQARALLAKGDSRGHWRVIAEAADRGGKPSIRIEALEQLTQQATDREDARAAAARLWETYLASAARSANVNHLLVGDDAAWATYASQRLQPDPFIARAFFAYLAQRAATPQARQSAYLELVLSLQKSRLELVSLRLLELGNIELNAISGEARYRLGTIAEAHDEAATAARVWAGLAAPSGMTKAEWETRRALVLWRANEAEAAATTLAAAANEKQALPAKAVHVAISLGQAMVASGSAEPTDTSLAALLQLVGAKHQRELLMALGDAAEKGGRFARAGSYFLQAALAPDGERAGATASKARLAAALSLARAGYKEDARAQLEWVIRHSRDAGEREVARKAQAKL
jgi:hypothetical protein